MRARARSRRTVGLRGDEALTLDLFAPLETTAAVTARTLAPPESRQSPRPLPLWLAVSFPMLPVVALSDPDSVQAVIEGPPGQQRLVALSAAAESLGLRRDLSRTAAEIRVPTLTWCERRPELEARALEARARAAFALTSFVSLEPPDTLLLEIRGSLRLFGGVEALIERALAALGTARIPATYAVAPTVRAALWLVRGQPGVRVESLAALPGVLARLPLSVTDFDATVRSTCERLGLSTIGELARLPRAGIARRLSPAVPRWLDEAFGREALPRRRHVLAVRFTEALALPAESTSTVALWPWCTQLLQAQERFLVQRDAAITQCRLRLHHRSGQPPTMLTLERSLPSARAQEWLALLEERLGRLDLCAPVVAVALRSGAVSPAVPLEEGLGLSGRDGRAASARLLDRLRARLGEEAVQGMCLIPAHCPESAFRRVRPTWPSAAAVSDALPCTPRPLWLLSAPQALLLRGTRPWYGGPLQVLSGPERIESGWWSGQGIARDYYIACAPTGARLWIYRERVATPQAGWFLHGVFA